MYLVDWEEVIACYLLQIIGKLRIGIANFIELKMLIKWKLRKRRYLSKLSFK